MSKATLETLLATLRFLTLLGVYVVALSLVGIARAGRAAYRRTFGRFLGAPSGATAADESPTAPR